MRMTQNRFLGEKCRPYGPIVAERLVKPRRSDWSRWTSSRPGIRHLPAEVNGGPAAVGSNFVLGEPVLRASGRTDAVGCGQ